jgi:hypothetical protein
MIDERFRIVNGGTSNVRLEFYRALILLLQIDTLNNTLDHFPISKFICYV